MTESHFQPATSGWMTDADYDVRSFAMDRRLQLYVESIKQQYERNDQPTSFLHQYPIASYEYDAPPRNAATTSCSSNDDERSGG